MDGGAGRRYGAGRPLRPFEKERGMAMATMLLAWVGLLSAPDPFPGRSEILEFVVTGKEPEQIWRLLGRPPIITADPEQCKGQSGPPNLIYVYPSLGLNLEIDSKGKIRIAKLSAQLR